MAGRWKRFWCEPTAGGLLSRKECWKARWNSFRLRTFGDRPPFGVSLKATTLEVALAKLAAQEHGR